MPKRPELAPAQARALGARQADVDAATAAAAKAGAAVERTRKRAAAFIVAGAPELVRAVDRAREKQDAANAKLAAAVHGRDELAATHMARLPVGRIVLLAGWLFERTQTKGRRSFQIAKYLDEGKHAITPEMESYYGAGEPTDHLAIRRAGA